jgi:hypothetical protein
MEKLRTGHSSSSYTGSLLRILDHWSSSYDLFTPGGSNMQGPSLETPLSRMTRGGPQSLAWARKEIVYIQGLPLYDEHEGILLRQIALSCAIWGP